MGPSFRIVMRSGPTPGKAFPLEKAETFIGRDLSNDVVINDPEISRRHSRIFIQNGTYILEDLGSTNGTSVNGQRLIGPYSMRTGEIITLGERITFVFETLQPGGDAAVSANGPQPESAAQPSAPNTPAVYSAPFYPASYDNPQARSASPISPQPRSQQAVPAQSYPPSSAASPSSYPPVQPVYPNPYPTASSAPQGYTPSAAPQYQQMPPAPPPAYDVDQNPFTGQVPLITGAEPAEVPTRAPIWPYIVIGVLLLIILVLVIDDFRLWCPLFGLCK